MKRRKWVRPKEIIIKSIDLPFKRMALCPKNLNGKKVSYLIVDEIDKFTRESEE